MFILILMTDVPALRVARLVTLPETALTRLFSKHLQEQALLHLLHLLLHLMLHLLLNLLLDLEVTGSFTRLDCESRLIKAIDHSSGVLK